MSVGKENDDHPYRIFTEDYSKNGKEYAIYDRAPVRKWQHLNEFETHVIGLFFLPRTIAEEGKPKVININFASPPKDYLHWLAREIIEALKKYKYNQPLQIYSIPLMLLEA